MPRSTKKVTFWDEAQTHGERVPLITVSGDAGPGSSASAAADAEGNQNTSFFHYYSSGFGGEDAVAALEKLPALLVLTCSVFTVSGCCSVVLGAVKSGLLEDMAPAWCLLPVSLACLWFIFELARSVVLVRRAMLDEEGRRVLSMRRMRRRLQRRSAAQGAGVQRQQQQQYRDIVAHAAAAAAAATRQGQEQQAAGAQASGFDDDESDNDDGDSGNGGGTGTGDGAEQSPSSLPSPAQPGGGQQQQQQRRPPLTRAPSSRLQRHLSRSGSSGDGTGETNAPRSVPTTPSPSSSSGDLSITTRRSKDPLLSLSERKESEKEADVLGWRRRRRTGEPKSFSPTPASPSSPSVSDPIKRAGRVSFLLQAWLRLFAPMAWFALTLFVTLILAGLRIIGVSGRYLPAGWISFPILLDLALLGLHSLLILDGSGGRGGGSVMRGGGHPLAVALLSRRSFIFLAFCATLLISFKIDSSANTTSILSYGDDMSSSSSTSTSTSTSTSSASDTSGLWAGLAAVIGKAHWGIIFAPLWAMFVLLETIYLAALWENYSGKSLACTLFDGMRRRDLRDVGGLGYWVCCCYCCRRCSKGGGGGGAAGGDGGLRSVFQCPPWSWGYGKSDSVSSSSSSSSSSFSSIFGSSSAYRHHRAGEEERLQGGARGPSYDEEEMRHHARPVDAAAYISDFGPIRQRMELNPSQRAAAAAIAAGVLLLMGSVVSVTVGSTRKEADWGVPLTIATAAAGLAMSGAGIRRLALAFYLKMRGPLPAEAKPLPVFYSDRYGGYIVGPPDPPMVTIFLLGDVTLRQEEFGWGDGGGGAAGCDDDFGQDSEERGLLWSSSF